ncbi:hypothetical protein [Methylophaga sp. OBS4]|uniref:hypothetical protein n=1 Tax=Methylophaga sp. OBS4 TaxID=2991935 RepID=UPI0022527D46|nr:hypothetical protein [Methylophaga sp. OBS4]MCX4187265.1 hypothetical protein [Methylophaga sp. OBS4]
MSINDAISHSCDLLQQLSTHPQIRDHADLQTIISQLASELGQIQSQAGTESAPASNVAQLDTQSGCYQFENSSGYFCPKCYEQHNQRVATQRLNKKLRVCPTCHASIRPLS